jgi:hypothetical protein
MISLAFDLFVVLLFVYLLVFPEQASAPTRNAVDFCVRTLVPSLFIYMILSKIIISLPMTEVLVRRFGLTSVMLVLGTLCGCPIGAKNAVTLFNEKKITKKHAEYLCSFTNNSSVSFLLGFVGSELFSDVTVGLKLLLFQLIASIATAVVMKFVIFGKEKLPKAEFSGSNRVGLRESVSDSAGTMINLCACASFFIVCGNALTKFFALDPVAESVLRSMLEFSSGCASAVNAGIFALPIVAFSVGGSGLSVALQVRSVTEGKLSMRPYLCGKMINASLMTFLAVIFG